MRNKKVLAAVLALATISAIAIPAITQADETTGNSSVVISEGDPASVQVWIGDESISVSRILAEGESEPVADSGYVTEGDTIHITASLSDLAEGKTPVILIDGQAIPCSVSGNTVTADYVVGTSDVNIDIDTVDVEVSNVTVHVSESVQVTDSENGSVVDGSVIKAGDVITINAASTFDGAPFSAITVNGEVVSTETAYDYTVPDVSEITIDANYSPAKKGIEVTFDSETITVITGEDNVISSGDKVEAGTTLTITADESYLALAGISVNGTQISETSPADYTVTDTDEVVTITAEYETKDPVTEETPVIFDEDKFSVRKIEEQSGLSSGDKVSKGQKLIIIVNSDVQFTYVAVNGIPIGYTASQLYIVEDISEPIEITAPNVVANITVTYNDENVTVATSEGHAIATGTMVSPGTVLTITAVDSEKALKGIEVNGIHISDTSPATYTVTEEDSTVAATAVYEDEVPAESATITFEEDKFSVKAIDGQNNLRSGDQVFKGQKLIIIVKDNTPFSYVAVNGIPIGYTAFQLYIVEDVSEPIEITAPYVAADTPVTYNSSDVTVTDSSGNVIASGSLVSKGTELTITAVDNEKTLTGINVNGGKIGEASPVTYTVSEDVEAVEITADFEAPATNEITLTYDSNALTVSRADGSVIPSGSRISPNDAIKVVANTYTDKCLSSIKANGEIVSSANGCEFFPNFDTEKVLIEAEYTDTNYSAANSSELSTYNSNNVEISCNSSEVDMFIDSKAVYGDTIIAKNTNTRVYFSIIEDPSRGTVSAILYNGQRIKPRGYFFIDINDYTFDHIVIEIEYES